MKKIGILTYSGVFNFGANLQALSSLGYFRQRGYEAKIIDWQPAKLMETYRRIPAEQAEAHRNFFAHYNCTRSCRNSRDVAEVIGEEEFDAVVIGSDAVIQYVPFLFHILPARTHILRHFMLTEENFIDNPFLAGFQPYLERKIPIVYLSASAQNMRWDYLTAGEKRKLRDVFSRADYVSVRDSWTQQLFEQLFNRQGHFEVPPITPDPVFAFNQNVIEQGISCSLDRFQLPDRYMLLSVSRLGGLIDENWIEEFKTIAESHSIRCLTLPTASGNVLRLKEDSCNLKLPINPLEWYQLIRNSCGYIGFNMHPMICCMHNNVPYFIFDHYVKKSLFLRKRNLYSSKIFDLLNRTGFLAQYCNAFQGDRPSPAKVFERLSSYPSQRGALTAELKYCEYLENMQNIENTILG